MGNNIHIAAYSSLIGAGKISLRDFSGISSRVAIYSSNDDYSGMSMTNPTIPAEFTNVTHADVIIDRHVIIGSGSVILPGLILEEGVAIGALSLVCKRCKKFKIYSGVPAKIIKNRKKKSLNTREEIYRKTQNASKVSRLRKVFKTQFFDEALGISC